MVRFPLRSVWCVALSVFFMFPLAVLAPLGYAVLFPVTAWSAYGFRTWEVKKGDALALQSFSLKALWPLGALHLWGGLSLLWTVDPERASITWISLALLSLSGIVLSKTCASFSDSEKVFITKSMVVGALLGALMLLFETVYQGCLLKFLTSDPQISMVKYNKATSIYTIFAWIFMGICFVKIPYRVFFFIVLGGVVFLLNSDTSKMALLLGGMVFCITALWPRVVSWAVGGLFAFLLLMPLCAQTLFNPETITAVWPNLKGSFVHRLHIWNYVGGHIREKPFQGWGLDSSCSSAFSKDRITFKTIINNAHGDPEIITSTELALSLHPHNGALQWWLELGGVGALLASFLFCSIAWSLRTWKIGKRKAWAFGAFTCAMAIFLDSYGAWQSWWISTLWLALIYGKMILEKPLSCSKGFLWRSSTP